MAENTNLAMKDGSDGEETGAAEGFALKRPKTNDPACALMYKRIKALKRRMKRFQGKVRKLSPSLLC